MRTTLDLPDELMRHLKASAALEGRSLRDFTLGVIERGLRAPAQVSGNTPVELPTVRLGRPMLLPERALSNAALDELAQE